MKKLFYLIIALLLSIPSTGAQNTSGTEFWLTFGANSGEVLDVELDLEICIVGGNVPATGTIKFTDLGSSIDFNISAHGIFTHCLDDVQKQAAYNYSIVYHNISNRSIHITSSEPVTVYAFNSHIATIDATNVLPVTSFGMDYYDISYNHVSGYVDQYIVIATENNTRIYHNNDAPIMLNAGEIYHRVAYSDITGAHITASHPVAFFACNRAARIPVGYGGKNNLFQQLPPVKTWGKNFFVPVSHLGIDRVRIVASENNTNIQQTGGIHISAPGGQTGPTYTINAGQFVELEILLSDNGCYIQSDQPIGICTYLTGWTYNGLGISDPSQAWVPAIEQTTTNAFIVPFIPVKATDLTEHYALVITATDTKDNTMVSIGGAAPEPLSGGSWIDNDAAEMSFYTMLLTNQTASYRFTNNAGLIIMGYGVGNTVSYYYLAASSMRDLTAAFYANDIPAPELADHLFCEKEITFTTVIQGLNPNSGSLKWHINGVEEVLAQDQTTWSKTFSVGVYLITMEVLFEDESTETYEGTLNIGAVIAATPEPSDKGSVEGDGCYAAGETVELRATPIDCWKFVKWTDEGGIEVSTANPYTFPATEDRTLTAVFEIIKRHLNVTPTGGGTVIRQ